MKILIGTKNAGKIESAKKAFTHYFVNIEIEGIGVSSKVSEQPIDEEIKKGALNRMHNLKQYCLENEKKIDFYVSIESGMINLFGQFFIMSLAVISDNTGNLSYGTSAAFPVPKKYVPIIKETNLNELFKHIYAFDQNGHNGPGGVGALTHDVINRIDLGEQAFVMALTEWINPEWRDNE